MILVTGGAGFIGSNLVASLNEDRSLDIVICDRLGRGSKWKNLFKLQIADLIAPENLMHWIGNRKLDFVYHLGAITETTLQDADLMMRDNFCFSVQLLNWCAEQRVPFIYASSAATYGKTDNFDDDLLNLNKLQPLNVYGLSKHMFDLAIAKRAGFDINYSLPPQWVGLKIFNAFGPNEYHKAGMASLIAQNIGHIKRGEPVSLFEFGEQKRDFIYVFDIIDIIKWFSNNPKISGIFNVGTGTANTFKQLMEAVYLSLDIVPKIVYKKIPVIVEKHYQEYTMANISKLRANGYSKELWKLEDAVDHYVKNFLIHL